MMALISPTAWAWSRPVDPLSRLVLLALADEADELGLIWDSPYRVLAKKTGLCRDTISKRIRLLGDDGYLMHAPGGTYRLMIPGEPQ
ncbi:hypothetical protein [Bombella pollinis]|uniref:Helix-turn-helix domain-containing protein n=1 Tax=Bombella pollinis TaxID=2967337 RepID=A0ABT3WMH6_9PROT|nr:hypothetical protein [Bombella pollinis]MCX5620108.1 helix-turn-helix domain-containing protein [Bombella pollinis]